MNTKAKWIDYEHGVSCIDTEIFRMGLASCYLIRQGEHAAFVDTGTSNSLPLLLQVLDAHGLTREQVRWVMPTHVHLDHAGGAGALMEVLPNAQLLVHERGAAHMIAPQKLQAGSLAVYGEDRYNSVFGDLKPVAEHRVTVVRDGDVVALGNRQLQFIDTPGHARHHYVVWDSVSRGLFCGDSFGVSYPELNHGANRFIFPPTTPVQFDPAAWHSTINRLLEFSPQYVYLTHFGRHDRVGQFAIELHQQIDAYVFIAEKFAEAAQGGAVELAALLMQHSWQELLQQNQLKMPIDAIRRLLNDDMELNAQGLIHWLQRR
jgi:glyoxylase-like metal-dependent hydrolase (beta-lactamase superfamily II)